MKSQWILYCHDIIPCLHKLYMPKFLTFSMLVLLISLLESYVSCNLYLSPHSRNSSPGGGSNLGDRGLFHPGSLAKTCWWRHFLGKKISLTHIQKRYLIISNSSCWVRSDSMIKVSLNKRETLKWQCANGWYSSGGIPQQSPQHQVLGEKFLAVSGNPTCCRYFELTRTRPKWRICWMVFQPASCHHFPNLDFTSLPAGLVALVCSGGSDCSFSGK